MAKFERRRTRQMGKAVRVSMLVVFLGLVIMVLVVYKLYSRVFVPNVVLDTAHELFYIPSGSSFEDVYAGLEEQGIIENPKSFNWVALKKGYDTRVKPGRYKIRNGLTNNELVNMLRSGNQDPVMVVFNNTRSLNHLSGKVSQYLEAILWILPHTFLIASCLKSMDLMRPLLLPCLSLRPMNFSGPPLRRILRIA